MKRTLLAAVLSLIACHAAYAAPTSPPPAATQAAPAATPAIPQKTHDDIMEFLQLTLGSKVGEFMPLIGNAFVVGLLQKHPEISSATSDEIKQHIYKIMTDPVKVKQLEESLVPAYAKVYSDDEIRQIIAFSKTSAGGKLVSGAPGKDALTEAMRPWLIGVVFPAVYLDTADVLKKQGITLENPGGNP